MPRKSSYPRELRDRAVRMVAEVRPNYEHEYAAIQAVAAKLGIGTAETVRKWVRQAEIDGGRRPGASPPAALAGAADTCHADAPQRRDAASSTR